jgi:nucleoid-associated protein YgaU
MVMTKCSGAGLMLAAGMLAGCATAPTQEMSDARQAVQAAREAGAPLHTPVAMDSAEQDLSQAEHKLTKRDYKSARDEAMAAKQQAVKARNMALAIGQAKEAVEEAERAGALTQVTRDWLAQAEKASAAGNEEEVMRTVRRAKQEAQDDMRRFQEEKLRAAQENQAWLDKVPPLLDEARREATRLSVDQQQALRRGEEAYQQHDGRKAYDLVNAVVLAVKSLPVLPRKQQYQVQKGDTLWRIAAQKSVYGNPLWWPLIYRDNHDHIPAADVLTPGQTLIIDLDPSAERVDLAVKHARRREGAPEATRKMDQRFLKDAR